MCKPIMKNGRCIAGNLKKTDLHICKGCEIEFIKDLKKAKFSGLIIRSSGKKVKL